MSPSAKRSRSNEETTVAGGSDGETISSSFVDKLLKLNTDRVASEGKDDVGKLDKLQDFCQRLQASIDKVKKVRNEEDARRREDDKKRKDDDRMKERTKYLSEKTCFECRKGQEDLSPCCSFQHEGKSGKGILICDDCYDRFDLRSCAVCGAFLCESEELCSGNCDDTYTCSCCQEITCLACVENMSHTWQCYGCSDIYCEDCAEENFTSECCVKCDEKRVLCKGCNGSRFDKCEGECNEPLCDDCVCTLACGNDVRLCGDCHYDCADCDMCDGVYHSRWQ